MNSRTSWRTVSAAIPTGQLASYFADDDRAQRNTIALRDVDYAVEAHFVLTQRKGPGDNVAKFEDMFARRLTNGQQHYQPYLGCREFPACVEPYTGTPMPLAESRPLGMMLHDVAYGKKNTAVFFPAMIREGEIVVPPRQGQAGGGAE